MADAAQVWFAPFRLDVVGELLWHEGERCALSPKAFATLRYLIEHPGQLVSKAALLDAVWPDTVVGDGVLTVAIAELRKVLGDDPRTPQFIETVHRRGYRWLAPLRAAAPVQSSEFIVHSAPAPPVSRLQPLASPVVGRASELAQLHNLFAKAMNGERQVVFVTGEAGSGKTTLIEAFRQRLEAGEWRLGLPSQVSSLKSLASPVSFAYGECTEHYSAGEAYLPLLDALARLCRRPDGTSLLDTLRQHAPTWLLQMPALLSAAEREQLRHQGDTTTRDRMVRELADAVAAFAATLPITHAPVGGRSSRAHTSAA